MDGLNFCAPEMFNSEIGHGLLVDEYAVGVLAYYLFSGMKDYPFKIPLSLTDDMEIYDYLCEEEVQFSQPIWTLYKSSEQIKKLIVGLLELNDDERLTAKEALLSDLFNDQKKQV